MDETIVNLPVPQLEAQVKSPTCSPLSPHVGLTPAFQGIRVTEKRPLRLGELRHAKVKGSLGTKKIRAETVQKGKSCVAKESRSTDEIVLTRQELKRLKQENWCFVCQSRASQVCFCKVRFYCSPACEEKASSHVQKCKRRSITDMSRKLSVKSNFWNIVPN